MSHKCVCGAVGELPIASLGTGLQQVFAAISTNTTTACMGCFKHSISNAAALQTSLVLPRSRNLPRQYQRRQQPNLRPRCQVMTTLGSQLWIGKPSVPQKLQARRLELLMVVLCPNSVKTVVMIVHIKVAKPSDGSTTTKMLAVGGLEKLGSVSTTPVQHTCTAEPCTCH